MSRRRLGFAGIGKMGALMAGRLITAGHPVTVYDTNSEAVDTLRRQGADCAGTIRDLADRVDVVFASLPTPDIVRSVALGVGGVVEGTTAKVFVDLSTTGPRVARLVAEGLAAKGIAAVDCPVSGGMARSARREAGADGILSGADL